MFWGGGGGGGGGTASGSLGLLYPRLLGLVYLISLLSEKGILTENSRMLCVWLKLAFFCSILRVLTVFQNARCLAV